MAESRKFIVYLENKVAEQKAEIDRLGKALSFVSLKAGAGLCQASLGGKHEFLKEISERCEAEGFDILGYPVRK